MPSMLDRNQEPKNSPENDRMNQIIQNRTKAAYGGTSAKLKYNVALKGKHKLARNTKALPGWRDLDRRFKGMFIGAGVGILSGGLLYMALIRTEFIRTLQGGDLLLTAIALLIIIIFTGAGFTLGKIIEQ